MLILYKTEFVIDIYSTFGILLFSKTVMKESTIFNQVPLILKFIKLEKVVSFILNVWINSIINKCQHGKYLRPNEQFIISNLNGKLMLFSFGKDEFSNRAWHFESLLLIKYPSIIPRDQEDSN